MEIFLIMILTDLNFNGFVHVQLSSVRFYIVSVFRQIHSTGLGVNGLEIMKHFLFSFSRCRRSTSPYLPLQSCHFQRMLRTHLQEVLPTRWMYLRQAVPYLSNERYQKTSMHGRYPWFQVFLQVYQYSY